MMREHEALMARVRAEVLERRVREATTLRFDHVRSGTFAIQHVDPAWEQMVHEFLTRSRRHRRRRDLTGPIEVEWQWGEPR